MLRRSRNCGDPDSRTFGGGFQEPTLWNEDRAGSYKALRFILGARLIKRDLARNPVSLVCPAPEVDQLAALAAEWPVRIVGRPVHGFAAAWAEDDARGFLRFHDGVPAPGSVREVG